MDNEGLKFELSIHKFKEAVLENNNENNLKYLVDVMKYFFDPEKPLPKCDHDSELIQHMTGGLKFDEFIHILQKNDNSRVCGKIFNEADFGFRCKTCQFVEGMFLCIECFKNGNHLNHEFFIKLCSQGSTCDCGDPLLLPKEEFCKDHKVSSNENVEDPISNEILRYTDIILPNMLYRLLQSCREEDIIEQYDLEIRNRKDFEDVYDFAYIPMVKLLAPVFDCYEFLTELSKGGHAIRRRIFNYLTDEEFYKKKVESENIEEQSYKLYVFQRINQKLMNKKALVQYPKELLNLDLVNCECKCMLDELMLWWIYTKMHHSILSFMLSILYSGERESFTKSFLSNSWMLDGFISLVDPSYNDNTSIDVHLFGHGNICKKLNSEHHLLEMFILRMYNVFYKPELLICSTLESNQNRHLVVDFNNIFVEREVLHDAFNMLFDILIHSDIAYSFIQKEHVFTVWIQLVSHLQGVCVNVRKHDYQDFYENNLYKKTYSIENSISSVVWILLNSIYSNSSQESVIPKVLNIVKMKLLEWLESIGIKGNKPNRDHLTFHLPLHRHYSIFLQRAIYKDDMSLCDILPTDPTTLLDILAHPLQIQVGMHEIQAGLWVKNGGIMTTLAQYYIDRSYCKFCMDADLFLIQCIACRLDPDIFVKTIFERFQVSDFCEEIIKADEQIIQNGQKIAMLKGALILISQIIYQDLSLALKDKNSTQNEVINILSYQDYSFSGIVERIPNTWEFRFPKSTMSEIVTDIADLVQPEYFSTSKLKNAKYILKEKYWVESYDPLFYMFYRSYKDESDVTFERYSKYVRSKNLCKNTNKLVLPFRLPSKNSIKESKLRAKFETANSKTLHSVLFLVLFQRLNSEMIDDKTFYLTLYLIEIALHVIEVNGSKDEEFKTESFSSNNILVNMCEIVPNSFIIKKNESEGNLEDRSSGETMISLLLKILYFKTKTIDENGTLKQAKFKFNSEISESRIGDECYFINNILNKAANLSSTCKHKINGVLTIIDQDHKCVDDDESVQKRLKAEDRQMKLLQKMLNMQKQFMDHSINENLFKKQISQISYEDPDNDDTYDCCICRTTSSSSSSNPIALICLATSSNLIGLCDSSNVKKSMNEPKQTKDTTLFYKENRRAELLNEAFSIESIKQSVNIGFKNGVYIITCGHYMHFDCYSKSTFGINTTTYNCPLCTQEANILIPIRRKYNFTDTVPIMNGSGNEIHFLEETLSIDPAVDANVFSCDLTILDNIRELIPCDFRYLCNTSESDVSIDSILLITSLLRTQLEVNYLQETNIKNLRLTRTCMLPYFELLSTLCQKLCLKDKPHLKLWHLLTRPDKYEFQEKEVPVLLRDPLTMTLLIILNWPSQIHRETFEAIANVIFNLTYIQNMLISILQLTDEQRRFITRKECSEINSIDGYLTYIASKLEDINHDEIIISSQQDPDECKLFTEKLCLPYLRLVSLLQCYLFGDEANDEDTFDSYLKVLNIKFERNDSKELLRWFQIDSESLLNAWFDQLLAAFGSNGSQVKDLLSLGSLTFKKPDLIDLPHLYIDLIFTYKNLKRDLYKNALDFAVCLFCGHLIEYTQKACLSHMKECCIDCAIYLSVYSSCVLFYVNNKCAIWSSVYLDIHGEEDINLIRGGQLYLSKERYNILKQIWFSHRFKHISLDWQ